MYRSVQKRNHQADLQPQAARSAANRIQQKVIHVKASHLGHQLNRLHHKAEFKAQKRGEKKWPAFVVQNWQKESKGPKCNHIPQKIQCHSMKSQLMTVFNKTADFLKQLQIIVIRPALKGAPHTFRKKQEIN